LAHDGHANALESLTAATGWPLPMDACLKIGERIAKMRQAFDIGEIVRWRS
jgi:hypothetical protein